MVSLDNGRSGRPSHVVVPRADNVVIGVDLGVDRIVVALVALGGEVLERRERAHHRGEHDVDHVIESVVQMVDDVLTTPHLRCLGLGVAIPGAVRAADGMVRFAPNLGWIDEPFTAAELDEAWMANAIFDAHVDDPEFGYRFLADEVRHSGLEVSDRTVWRICRDNQWWSVFGKPKRGKGSKPGTAAHDDLVRRNFNATVANQVWVADLTEHWTLEGKVYCCAIKDLYSNRIVGWSLDSRMKARLVVAAIEMAVARRGGDVAGCIVHSDRGSQFRARKVQRALTRHGGAGDGTSGPDRRGPGWVVGPISGPCRRTASSGPGRRP